MNTELLLKVKAAILAEPRKFVMEDYIAIDPASPCGTVCCIAGHAIAIDRNWPSLKTGLKSDISFFAAGKEALQISSIQACYLFDLCDWPEDLLERYKFSETAQERAQIAAERIDCFISTNGAE